jgi:hypothetical protein
MNVSFFDSPLRPGSHFFLAQHHRQQPGQPQHRRLQGPDPQLLRHLQPDAGCLGERRSDPDRIGRPGVASTSANFSNGNLDSTGVDSNMALQGNGFFVVQNASGDSYTRAGDFTVNSSGQLAAPDGDLVMGYPAVNGVVSTSAALAPISVNQSATIPGVATTTFQMNTNLDSSAGGRRDLQHAHHGLRLAGYVADPDRQLHKYVRQQLDLQHHASRVGHWRHGRTGIGRQRHVDLQLIGRVDRRRPRT